MDFLEQLDVPCYKIASFENTHLPLVRRVAATGKPMIISAGMATVAELDETVSAAREAACKDLALLKCTSGVALGGTIIEKHFTLSRQDGGVDSTFSIQPPEMAQLVLETERAWQALGSVTYGPTEAETQSTQFRRSLYLVEDIKAGDTLSNQNVRAVRPGRGLPPKYLEVLIGRRVNRDVCRGTPVTWDILS